MGNIFSYESKLMQALMYIGDLIILNVLFVLCCIPIFTIGAAQTGLYSGLRVLMDKEDDSSPSRAFFKGFADGFGRITLIWLMFLVLFVLIIANLVPVMVLEFSGYPHAPVAVSLAGLILCAIFYNLIVLFHTRFSCTFKQLFRNSLLMIVAHPLRSILSALIVWIPLLIPVLDFYLFMQLTPVILAVGFSVVFLFSFTLTNKPFMTLIQHFNDQNNPKKEGSESAEAEALPEETTL